MSAVDGDNAAGHKRAGTRNQQQQRAVEFSELAETALRYALDQCFSGIALEKVVIQLCHEIPGRERVDANAITRPFQRQRLACRQG